VGLGLCAGAGELGAGLGFAVAPGAGLPPSKAGAGVLPWLPGVGRTCGLEGSKAVSVGSEGALALAGSVPRSVGWIGR
jgi:hypothetical protein